MDPYFIYATVSVVSLGLLCICTKSIRNCISYRRNKKLNYRNRSLSMV